MSLIIADAVVIAAPPIPAPRNEGLSAQPPAIVVGVVIGAVDPDPDAVPKHPMPMIEAVKVVASVREPAMLEPIPTVVALNESITITMLETATLAAFCEPRSTSPGPSKAAAVTTRHCAVMAMAAAVAPRHCAGMSMAAMAPTAPVTARHCPVMPTATMATATVTPTAAASKTSASTMAPTAATAVAAAPAAAAAISTSPTAAMATPAAATAAAATPAAAMANEGHCATGAESAFQVGDTCRLSRPPHKGR